MRDWLITNQADRDCLKAARDSGKLNGTWRPWHGQYARAARLCKNGLLKAAGISAMPPHVVYIISDAGSEELEVASRLETTGGRHG